MDIKKIESIATNVVTPVDYKEIKVDFGDGILPDFGKTYVNAMNQKLALRGSAREFDVDQMNKYLNTILLYRVMYTAELGRVDSKARMLKIPALYATSLTHIGTVYDKDLGIQLTPELDKKAIKTMSIEEALQFSRELDIVEDLGFELVEGMPRDKNGEADFMYFHMSEGNITRHDNRAHPSFAVLSAFFRMKQLENVLTYRVTYGLVTEYEEMLKGLIYDEAR